MSKFVVIHDRRLIGTVPHQRDVCTVRMDKQTPMVRAFRAIRHAAELKPVTALLFLCHGYSGIDRRARVSLDAGGMGLQLGKEDVKHDNVSMWRAIRDKVGMIVVHSCAAADTQPANAGTTSDGQYLMGALAIHTNAPVYAANLIQRYATGLGQRHGHVDFGRWEGILMRFDPSGKPPERLKHAPWEYGVPIKKGEA